MPKETIPFRWKYIILSLAVFLLSMAVAAYFYRLLPAEVVYYFKVGSPEKWMSRSAFIAWMLIPQFFLALFSVFVVWGVIKLSARFQQSASAAVEKILAIMGNMVAMPQIILSFAMLDIFSYNAYQTHIMPLWIFALIVMVVGGLVLGIFFISAIWRVWRLSGRSFKER